MRICILLTYANPHVTGWLDEFIEISDHEIIVGVMNSVKKYRKNYFGEADNKKGYLYFFKADENSKKFYAHVSKCDCLITLGIFEKLFMKAFLIRGTKKIFVLSEPFNPFNKRKFILRNIYVGVIKYFNKSSQFYFLCMGGIQVKKEYRSIGFKKSFFLEYGHFPKLQLSRKPLYQQGETIRFMYVGQLIFRKGVDKLIDLIRYLQQKYDRWEFLIIGDGILKDDLLKSFNEEERITYIDNINNGAILKSHYNHKHILFLPSYFDGWGAVVNEALSSCCSLMLSEKVYAGKSLLQDGINGFKFNPHRIDELHAAVDKYFKDPFILNGHFKESENIFNEWNHENAAFSFNNFLNGKENTQNKLLLTKI